MYEADRPFGAALWPYDIPYISSIYCQKNAENSVCAVLWCSFVSAHMCGSAASATITCAIIINIILLAVCALYYGRTVNTNIIAILFMCGCFRCCICTSLAGTGHLARTSRGHTGLLPCPINRGAHRPEENGSRAIVT